MTGAELKKLRLAAGLTQGQAARFLGIGRTSLWRLEKEKRDIYRMVEVGSQAFMIPEVLNKWIEMQSAEHCKRIRRRQAQFGGQVAPVLKRSHRTSPGFIGDSII
jgi:DNA-binding XRE family transcriptional regulator